MLKAKKSRIMRHPYISLMVLGLAVTGAVHISNSVRNFFEGKARCVGNMVREMKDSSDD